MNDPTFDIMQSPEGFSRALAACHYMGDAEQALRENSLTLEQFGMLQRAWSQTAFGFAEDRGPLGPLKHLRKEVDEAVEKAEALAAAPKDKQEEIRAELLGEFADLFFLVLDPLWRAGFGLTDLRRALARKLIVNRSRTWNKTSADEAVEHDRGGEIPEA